MVDWRNNPECPLAQFLGNADAKDMLSTIAHDALGKPNHLCRDLSIALLAGPGTGKTTLVKLLAELIDLPMAEVSPKAVKTLDDLVSIVGDVLQDADVPLTPYRPGRFFFPPMIIFIDEVHALSDSVVQGLLKATEHGDAVLVTESGKVIDTYNVFWIIATTDGGKLFDAFRSRFAILELFPLGKEDLVKVVLQKNDDMDEEAAQLVAHYVSRNTRKALEFARYMRLIQRRQRSTWKEAAREVARQYGIDEKGMHRSEMDILRALKDGPIAQNRISNALPGKKREEVENYILPPLMSGTEPLVRMGSKGYELTDEGRKQLL